MGPSWLTALLAALVVTLVATPVMRRLARSVGLVDNPNARKVHNVSIPYLGGAAIALGVLLGLILAPGLEWRMAVVGVIALSLCVLGFFDDRRPLSPAPRIAVELTAALATLALGLRLDVTGVGVIDAVLTLAWIVGLTNAANLLDNMDGLAAGTAGSIAFGALLLTGGVNPVATLAAAVAGACLGFLAYNKRPASIYMGDAGSLFLGYMVSVITLAAAAPLAGPDSFLVPLMLAAIPIADTTTVVLARLRRGISPAQAGKDHLSHRLVWSGLGPGKAVLVLTTVSLLVGLAGMLAGRQYVPTALAVGSGLTVLGLLFSVALRAQVYETPGVGQPYRGNTSNGKPATNNAVAHDDMTASGALPCDRARKPDSALSELWRSMPLLPQAGENTP
jgi:UDP-GlcNAc:undecaprenyl-phosphate/decaprenyl-phosphate GlcNAc-1-phosphate transferase